MSLVICQNKNFISIEDLFIGLASSASSHALGESSPPLSPITMSHTTPSIFPSGLTSTSTGGMHNYSGVGVGGASALSSYMPSGGYSSTVGGVGVVGGTSSLGNTLGHSYTNKSILGTSLGTTGLPSALSGVSGVPGVPGLSGVGVSSLSTGLGGALGGTALSAGAYSTNTTFTNPLLSNSLPPTSFSNPTFAGAGATNINQFGLSGGTVGGFSSLGTNNVTFSNPLSSQFNSLPMSIKLKPLDEVELGARRVATPVTPHQTSWGLGASLGLTSDPTRRILTDGLDSDWSGVSGLMDRSYLNGHQGLEGTVDMLDIPGKGRCSVYIARYTIKLNFQDQNINFIDFGLDFLMTLKNPKRSWLYKQGITSWSGVNPLVVPEGTWTLNFSMGEEV